MSSFWNGVGGLLENPLTSIIPFGKASTKNENHDFESNHGELESTGNHLSVL